MQHCFTLRRVSILQASRKPWLNLFTPPTFSPSPLALTFLPRSLLPPPLSLNLSVSLGQPQSPCRSLSLLSLFLSLFSLFVSVTFHLPLIIFLWLPTLRSLCSRPYGGWGIGGEGGVSVGGYLHSNLAHLWITPRHVGCVIHPPGLGTDSHTILTCLLHVWPDLAKMLHPSTPASRSLYERQLGCGGKK